MIRILQSKDIGGLLARRGARLSEAEAVVRPILEAVRKRGDRALLEYARQFDGLQRKSVRVSEPELLAARRKLAPEFCRAVETASANIRAYAQRQMPREWSREMQPGLRLGDMFLRTTKIKFVVFPRPAPFRGPLAILVDGCSASTSEIFAGGMQDLKRARVFGERTAGAALPSMFERLPNGDGFQYAIANYISEGGKQLEGAGVIPDETAAPSRRALLEGHDPALDRALAWIEGSKN